jgi:hypothetical protein
MAFGRSQSVFVKRDLPTLLSEGLSQDWAFFNVLLLYVIGKNKKDITFYSWQWLGLPIKPDQCLRDFKRLDYIQKCDLESQEEQIFPSGNRLARITIQIWRHLGFELSANIPQILGNHFELLIADW